MNNEPIQPYVNPAPVPNYNPPVGPAGDDPGKTLGIIGFIFAFVGLQLIGLILSIIGHNKSHKAGFKNTLAVVGIWLNSAFILLVALPIFALIVVTAYSGVSTRADTKQAETNAMTTQKVAEAYNADANHYPDTTAELKTGSTSAVALPSAISLLDLNNSSLNSANGLTTIWYQYTGTAGAATGGRARYWDFAAKQFDDLYTGGATENSVFHELN